MAPPPPPRSLGSRRFISLVDESCMFESFHFGIWVLLSSHYTQAWPNCTSVPQEQWDFWFEELKHQNSPEYDMKKVFHAKAAMWLLRQFLEPLEATSLTVSTTQILGGAILAIVEETKKVQVFDIGSKATEHRLADRGPRAQYHLV
ncbi:hypothetical protein Salat_1698100 [Sesamum alatum]|uniref:Uncharacterized protein n=1 Tax=Sesamum alatum TaxID=300844 RepID=A0AAE2CK15_9LAMI|nr:hypothetical protein Salat_1698100 [Sesamum alatum]